MTTDGLGARADPCLFIFHLRIRLTPNSIPIARGLMIRSRRAAIARQGGADAVKLSESEELRRALCFTACGHADARKMLVI
jgi:hypothetical protein